MKYSISKPYHMSMSDTYQQIPVAVRNLGGIDSASVELEPGVTVLEGRNATNRTSFLRSLMAALGSDDVSLRGGADEGSVELTLGDETYTRTLTREGDRVAFGGEPLLDDATTADLFAFLLETNEARQAVTGGADLREVLMRPVDTDEIQAAIEDRLEERREVDRQLEEVEQAKERLAERKSTRAELEDELAALREKRDALAAEIDDANADPEAAQAEDEELADRLEELNEKRDALESARYDLETARQSRDQLESELDGLSVDETEGDLDDRISELDDEIETLRAEKRQVDALVGKLQNLIQFNEEMLEGDAELRALLSDDTSDSSGTVTDQLVTTDETTCWTCGSEVPPGDIEATLDRLRSANREQFSRRKELESNLESTTDERDRLQRRRREHKRERDRIETLRRDLERKESDIDRLEANCEELEQQVDRLDDEVTELRATAENDVLDRYAELNDLEFEIGQLSSRIESVDEAVDQLEERVAGESDLTERREELGEEIEELRTRIDRLEQEAVEEFNERAADLLDILGYENIERLWLERREEDVREGRQKVRRSIFDLHVVRKSADGTAYEDQVSHLSESEREVTGLVFALAGYLVHEVYEEVPFVLLDSLEAIDSERISTLVQYVADVAPNVVVALLPEDAAALPESTHRVTEI